MGYWGVKSYEGDDAAEAMDAGFERVHGAAFEALMDDRNPLGFDQVYETLADPRTLAASVEALGEMLGGAPEDWDDEGRLAFAGVVVRHAELGIPIPEDWRLRALATLESEEIEWEEATLRRLRLQREVALLKKMAPGAGDSRGPRAS